MKVEDSYKFPNLEFLTGGTTGLPSPLILRWCVISVVAIVSEPHSEKGQVTLTHCVPHLAHFKNMVLLWVSHLFTGAILTQPGHGRDHPEAARAGESEVEDPEPCVTGRVTSLFSKEVELHKKEIEQDQPFPHRVPEAMRC